MTRELKRPERAAGINTRSVIIGNTGTGEIEEVRSTSESGVKNPAAVALGRMGGKARAASISKKRRKEIARKAAQKRWAT